MSAPALAASNPRPSFIRSISASSSTVKTQKHKPRLYIALYPRARLGSDHDFSCDSQHWALVVGPEGPSRAEAGTRYHLQHSGDGDGPLKWLYDEQDMQDSPSQKILVRIAIAKVTNPARLASLLRDLPIQADDTGFNCLTWVRDAVVALVEDGRCLKGYIGPSDWQDIEKRARMYVRKKREQRRFTGEAGPWSLDNIPTWNFWENRETAA